jgi:hypothetical protein
MTWRFPAVGGPGTQGSPKMGLGPILHGAGTALFNRNGGKRLPGVPMPPPRVQLAMNADTCAGVPVYSKHSRSGPGLAGASGGCST